MKTYFIKAVLTLLGICASGCATTQRGKTLQLMAAGFLTGAAYGASQDGQKPANAALWGGLLSTGAATVGLIAFDEEKDLARLSQENQKLRETLARGERAIQDPPSSGKAVGLSSSVPTKLKDVFTAGTVEHSAMDEWEQDPNDERIWYHKTEQVELIPPQIKSSN